MRNAVLPHLLLLSVASSALAQDVTDDWEIILQPENDTVFAYAAMSTGLTLGFRCMAGDFGAVLGGLPEAKRDERTRELGIGFGGEPVSPTRWSVTTDRTVAIADYPAPLARQFREGGPVDIVIPGAAEGGRSVRHRLVFPASGSAIDQTLTACERPLVDPRDALLPEIEEDGLPDGVNWQRAPRPRYPNTNYGEGYAVVSCVVQPAGGVEQCQLESEFPRDGGFGRAALRSTEDARLVSPGETPGAYAPRMIAFRVNFRMR